MLRNFPSGTFDALQTYVLGHGNGDEKLEEGRDFRVRVTGRAYDGARGGESLTPVFTYEGLWRYTKFPPF